MHVSRITLAVVSLCVGCGGGAAVATTPAPEPPTRPPETPGPTAEAAESDCTSPCYGPASDADALLALASSVLRARFDPERAPEARWADGPSPIDAGEIEAAGVVVATSELDAGGYLALRDASGWYACVAGHLRVADGQVGGSAVGSPHVQRYGPAHAGVVAEVALEGADTWSGIDETARHLAICGWEGRPVCYRTVQVGLGGTRGRDSGSGEEHFDWTLTPRFDEAGHVTFERSGIDDTPPEELDFERMAGRHPVRDDC